MVLSVCSTMDIQHTTSVPTKQPSSGGGGLTKELRLSRGSNNGEASRRKSSSSNNSFDLAASLFSSMQNLESSGRSLSTVLNPASTDGPLLMTTGARLNISGRGGFPVVEDPMMGVGQNLRLPPRNLMHLFPSAQMGGSLPHINPLQAAPNLDVMRGGYLPSSKLQGSITINDSNMNYFTTQELMNELSRRRSERRRASAVLDATPAMFSAEQFSKVARLMKGGQSPDPRDSRTRRGSEDSLELLAATANFNTMRERVTEEKQNTNQTQDTCADTVDVRTVPTCFKPATKNAKRKKDKDVLSDASDVSEEEITGNERKKAKRSSSSNSLDVLLTALGDDLEQLDNKNTEKAKVTCTAEQKDKDELLRRFSKDSVFSSMSDEDLICRPVSKNNIHDNSQRKGKQSILAPLLDTRSSYTMPSKESDAMFYPAHGLNPDYTRRLQASHSLMASLESEMIRNDIGIREFALREIQRRQLAAHMMQNSLQSTNTPQLPVHPKAEQQIQLPAKLPPADSRSVTLSTIPVSVNSHEPAEETHSLHAPKTHQTPTSSIDHTRSPLPWNKKAEKPSKIPPKEALEKFLSAHGEKGATLREAVLKAISETESSLATIHAWDRSQGLRKCHSRTVVKTRRSRAHLKAFLMGVEPPTEPHQNRKRPKKNKSKKVNVFGPPRDRK